MYRKQVKWTIISLTEAGYSFIDFFTLCITPRLPSTSQASEDPYTLKRAEVGLSKDRLDYADISLKVIEVTESFGKFVKLLVKPQQANPCIIIDDSEVSGASRAPNAFQVLLASQNRRAFLEPIDEISFTMIKSS